MEYLTCNKICPSKYSTLVFISTFFPNFNFCSLISSFVVDCIPCKVPVLDYRCKKGSGFKKKKPNKSFQSYIVQTKHKKNYDSCFKMLHCIFLQCINFIVNKKQFLFLKHICSDWKAKYRKNNQANKTELRFYSFL